MNNHTRWIIDAIESLAKTGQKKGEYWRATYTEEDAKAIQLLKEYMEQKGMATYFDAVGNLYGRIQGRTDEIILAGSHRDTVRNGGKYDGILGVLMAIEVVGALYEEQGQPEKTIEVVAFCEEESSRFPTSYLGSRFVCGEFYEDELNDVDRNGISLRDAMEAAGYLKEPITSTKKDKLERFIELHIEQGGLLENQEKQVGIVNGVVGLFCGEIYFKGHQNHAGTTPMFLRKDPMPVVAEFICRLNQWAKTHMDELVCTVGQVRVEPGNTNVIPDKVTISFDIRSISAPLQLEARETIQRLREELGRKIQISVSIPCDEPPVQLDGEGVKLLEEITKRNNLAYMKMVSGAGHDAQVIGQHFRTNLIFLPSVDGISHSTKEYTKSEDIEVGFLVMKDFINEIAYGVEEQIDENRE